MKSTINSTVNEKHRTANNANKRYVEIHFSRGDTSLDPRNVLERDQVVIPSKLQNTGYHGYGTGKLYHGVYFVPQKFTSFND